MKHYAAICYDKLEDSSLDFEVYRLAMEGYTLRSNLNQRFEKACDAVNGRKIIRCSSLNIPWLNYARIFAADEMSKVNDNALGRYAAVCSILLGDKLNQPAEFCFLRGNSYTEFARTICVANNIKVL